MVTLQASVATTILPQAITRTLISSGMQAPATTTMTIATQPASDPGVAYINSMPVGMAGSGSGYGVNTFVPSAPSLASYSGPATNVGPSTGSGPTPTIMLTPTAMDTSTSTLAPAPPESLQLQWQTVALAPP